jgi:hypothetical protein
VLQSRKSRAFWLIVAAATATLVAASWAFLFRGDGITQANYERIQEGMTQYEVETLLGGPPGNYALFTYSERPWGFVFGNWPALVDRFWIGENGCVKVTFNGGMVASKGFIPPDKCRVPLPANVQFQLTFRRLQLKASGIWPTDY